MKKDEQLVVDAKIDMDDTVSVTFRGGASFSTLEDFQSALKGMKDVLRKHARPLE